MTCPAYPIVGIPPNAMTKFPTKSFNLFPKSESRTVAIPPSNIAVKKKEEEEEAKKRKMKSQKAKTKVEKTIHNEQSLNKKGGE